jgi:AcrR family transcriptional regulator
MAGLRERKKRATRAAIHRAGMELFQTQGFAGTTVDQIADAADVSRATVFTYFATKEDIVFGDGPRAVEALGASLRGTSPEEGPLPAIRAWLRQLTEWMTPELPLQLQLAHDVPAVGARRLRLFREVEQMIADALRANVPADGELAARLGAAALVTAFGVAEETAADRMTQGGPPLDEEEIDRLLDEAVAFAQAGMAALHAGPRA